MTWFDLLAATEVPPPAPPEIPYETIGTVLVALLAAISGIVIAIVQRGKKKSEPAVTAPTSPTAAPVFVVSREEYTTIRDAVTRIDAVLTRHLQDYDYHERRMQGESSALLGEVNRIKGHLGMP